MPEFVNFLRPRRPTFPGDANEAELKIIEEHDEFLRDKLAAGELILAGRTQDENSMGICVFEADDIESAHAFANQDPLIAKGLYTPAVQPYRVFLMRGRV